MPAPVPVGTGADIAFGGAIIALGVGALLLMGNGFNAGLERDERRDGMGLPGAPSARRARGRGGKGGKGGNGKPKRGNGDGGKGQDS